MSNTLKTTVKVRYRFPQLYGQENNSRRVTRP
jgi:hypothetical protein